MKNICRLLIALFFLSATFVLSAQESPFSFGVKAGFNISNTSFEVDEFHGYKKKEPKPGFNVGITAGYAFTKAFSVQSGVSYTTKGVKAKGFTQWIPTGQEYWEHRFNMGYLQLPLMAQYTLRITDDFNFFFQAGPYIAYGISGKTTSKYRFYDLNDKPNEKEKTDVFDDDGLKRFDWGLTAGLGTELNRIFIVFNYELGLVDISGNKSLLPNNPAFKHRNTSLSFGYRF